MYVTRPLSLCKNFPVSLSASPPEGPNSGYLVVQDEESMTPCCFGLCKSDNIDDLPLPSNKILAVDYDSDEDDLFFAIPAINKPLSANLYYLIKARGSHRGEAYASSKEEDKAIGCGGSRVKDVKPRPLDPDDIYQQFRLSTTLAGCTNDIEFKASSVTPEGHPPRFLRRRGGLKISVSYRTSKDFIQGEANGLNSTLRARLPDFNFPISREFSVPVCVGKWYCPFMFIHDGKVKDQVKKSVYYEIRLEQWWERIFTCENSYTQGNKAMIDVVVPTEVVAIGGKPAARDGRSKNTKVAWFRTIGSVRQELSVGLSTLVFERMIWEEERIGWVNANEGQIRVVREEACGGNGWSARCGCYVLVERFIVTRMDASLVMTYDFKHAHQIKTKWEKLIL